MSEIQKSFGEITLDTLKPHEYKAGLQSAQIRQVVTTTYPSMRVGNSGSDLLFSIDKYNLPEGKSFTSTRVTWLNVPNGTTEDDVKAALAAAPNSRIYRKISYRVEDVMTAEQHNAVTAGLRTLEQFKNQLLVQRVNEQTGEIENIPGKPQYAQNFWSKVGKADEDFRENVPTTDNVLEHELATKATTATVNAAAEGVTI